MTWAAAVLVGGALVFSGSAGPARLARTTAPVRHLVTSVTGLMMVTHGLDDLAHGRAPEHRADGPRRRADTVEQFHPLAATDVAIWIALSFGYFLIRTRRAPAYVGPPPRRTTSPRAPPMVALTR